MDHPSQAGKVALVTGGSRGIGLSIARALVDAGAQVAITGRDRAHLDAAVEQLGAAHAHAVQADVGDAAQAAGAVSATVLRFGGLDIVVNNAGIGEFAPVADMAVEAFDRILRTNISGVFYCCRAAIPRLRERGGGWIVNISSLAGSNPFAGAAAYCASKAAVDAFTAALMQEVRADNIRVCCIAPGSVSTGFSGRGDHGAADWKLSPDDVAQVVTDLLRYPARSLPSRVELRPSRPQKR